MAINVGRLKSYLSYSELLNSIKRETHTAYSKCLDGHKALSYSHYENFLKYSMDELKAVHKIAEKARVWLVRLEERLKPVEATLIQYKKKAKKDPKAKLLLGHINNFMMTINNIKKAIKEEAKRAAREERKIRHNI